MDKQSISLYKKLAPCGNEKELLAFIQSHLAKSYAVKADAFGNLIASRAGSQGDKTIAILMNVDEAGFIVSGITKNGRIVLQTIGNIQTEYLGGKRIQFQNGLLGVIVPDKKTSVILADMGAASEEDASQKISLGDFAVFAAEPMFTQEFVIARNASQRSTCAMMLQLLLELPQTPHDIRVVFATQGMFGNRGLQVISNYLSADAFVSLEWMEVPVLWKEPVLTISDKSLVYDRHLIHDVMHLAQKKGIPLRQEILNNKASALGLWMRQFPQAKKLSVVYGTQYAGTESEIISQAATFHLKSLIALLLSSDIMTRKHG